ncbi:MAG: hypothetical protein M1821_006546 [Bathelium mastoideum]|nr:MAG: hypothetical protein M1821_006546 [Bathelium mastoideum]KAI9693821.1 MAG: hypothetical protein M1822_003092 [Bathelium mastoideum]
MSGFFRPRNLAVAGGAISVLFLVPTVTGGSFNPFHTREVQNITDRFNSGGGADTHTPAVGTPLGEGNKDAVVSSQQTRNGPDSAKFRDGIEGQRTHSDNALTKAWNQTHYGNDKGK